MTRHLLIFAITCVLGAAIALVVRTARHQPFVQPPAEMQAEHAAPAPTAMQAKPAAPAPALTAAAAPLTGQPVNTICAICGDPVDPKLPFAEYKGHVIGFGCGMCPPKFKKNPEKYGEAALKNLVVEE